MTTKTNINPGLTEALASVAAVASIPEAQWTAGGDDLCDCMLQQIWEVTNPYSAQTVRVRLCCLLAAVEARFPEFSPFIQHISAWYDVNRHKLQTASLDWDSPKMAMPTSLWYRQIAHRTGRPLAEVRAEYAKRKHERPQKGQRRNYVQPTAAEIAEGHRQRLIATGWIVEANGE